MKLFSKFLCLLLTLCVTAKADDAFKPDLYAFSNGMPRMSFDDEAKMLKDLGYTGISQLHTGDANLDQRVAAYKKHGLKVLSVYLPATDKPINAQSVTGLADGGMIELTVEKVTPEVVKSIRATAEMAEKLKIKVVLYPHFGLAIATIPQALDLVKKVNHKNLGIMFNLCHFLKSEDAADLESILDQAAPHLFAVSTCGADLGGKSWDQLIRPLDQGTFPQKRLFAKLKKLNFKGPVTLQCYAVKGDKRTNLTNSMAAWKKILAEVQ